MTAVDDDSADTAVSTRWRAPVLVAALLLGVAVVGWNVGTRFGPGESDFYATVAQVIATLFIAVFLESFTNDHPLWHDGLDRVLVLALLTGSLLGLFVCLRGLLGHGNGVTAGIAAAGLLCGLLLVGLALIQRMRAFARPSAATVPPLIVLSIFVIVALAVLVYTP